MNWSQLLTIGLFSFFTFTLLVVDIQHFPQFAIFLVSAGVNDLLFLCIGSIVLLYNLKNKTVSLLLFVFCASVAIVFSSEGGATSGETLFTAIADSSSALAVVVLALLLIIFPQNGFRMGWVVGRHLYIVWTFVLGTLAFSFGLLMYFTSNVMIFLSLGRGCFLLLFVGIIWHLIASYRAANATDRQQLRFFLFGLLMALCPLLFLTVLPQTFDLPSIPGQWSSLTLVFLPAALGYAVLRYQLLVPDRFISRCVKTCLCLMFFLIGFIPLEFLITHTQALSSDLRTTILTIVFLVLMLLCWQGARIVTERWVLVELRYFRDTLHRFVDNRSEIDGHDLPNVSSVLLSALVYYFGTVQSCLLILDESTGVFRSFSPDNTLNEDDLAILRLVCQKLGISAPTEIAGFYTIPKSHLTALAGVPRPLLLSEAATIASGKSFERRYLIPLVPRSEDLIVLAPLRIQKEMVGLLIAGQRQSHVGYASPDLEKLQALLDEFMPLVETARLYTRAAQHALLLEQLYEANIVSPGAAHDPATVAFTYSRVASEACNGRAEIWLYEAEKLQFFCGSGNAPRITTQNYITFTSDQHWSSYFYEGNQDQLTLHTLPACFDRCPAQSFAWLPLHVGSQRVGILVLTFANTHLFAREEQRVLGMFAAQCAIALDNARMTRALRDAYEHQKELDRLKDQFIVTASHELRTPLTAVQGYIELLSEYSATLTPELRSTFIAKARRGCDELTLMVGNIMDASRVRIEASNIHLTSLVLRDAVLHVLEILEALVRREERSIEVLIDPETLVLADDMRLHQVLLNLLSNALKYSPSGTPVEISTLVEEKQVTVCIRDYGFGIPIEEQAHLFERFVRLERDMNSIVRGAGLGLFISRQLVEAMDGRIWVESSGQAGEGSTFAFTLRRSQPRSQLPTRHEKYISDLPLL